MRYNPFLPSWEYIPDGEPHVYGDRVYLYGSHDRFNGHAFCLNDYVCWSAPAGDLTDWRYEGVIYGRADDPRNADGKQCLYAPDVTRGPDGRYYLFYVLNASPFVSVAVCDTPAGRYRFHGHVHYPDGSLLGERPGDEPQFDPGVLTEGDKTYLYGGFCPANDPNRHGPMATVLGPDMLTVVEEPRFIMPSAPYSAGSGYEDYEYFEAASIRKVDGLYCFVYSSSRHHSLCYATSDRPTEGFRYRGVVVSNVDAGIDRYKPAERLMAFPDNNHGGIAEINGRWYSFYHRHTNGHSYSRQACLEPIEVGPGCAIRQAEVTSCGPNGGPLPGEGAYPAYIACTLTLGTEAPTGVDVPGIRIDAKYAYVTQDGRDGDEVPQHIANMRDTATAGFKFFDCRGTALTGLTVRGWCDGAFEVLTAPEGEVLGRVPVGRTDEWQAWTGRVPLPDGVNALFLRYRGPGYADLLDFTLSIQK